MPELQGPSGRRRNEWTFLSNHAHVLICIDRDSSIRTRDIAVAVGITERATQAIISDLVEAGYLERHREGRRNRYTVNTEAPCRHPIEANHSVGDLFAMLEDASKSTTTQKGKKTG